MGKTARVVSPRVKWGIVGTGTMGCTAIKALKEAASAEVVAITDVNAEARRKAQETFEIEHSFDNLELLLEKTDVDAIYIATPPYLHCQQAVQAAEAGKHVFCEKPMAMSEEECQRMIEACKRNGVKLMVGFKARFNSYHQHLRKMIVKGELGELVFLRAERIVLIDCKWGWHEDPRISGGGVLADLGTHAIDLLRYLAGSEVTSVRGITSRVTDYHSPEIEETGSILLRFANNAQGIINISIASPIDRADVWACGTRGEVICRNTLGGAGNGSMEVIIRGKRRQVTLPANNEYQCEVEHFSQCILHNRQPLISGEDGLECTRILTRVYQEESR